MKIRGFIVGAVVVCLASQSAFAWKDKSKMTNDDRNNDRLRNRDCIAECDNRLNAANSRCSFVFSDVDQAVSRSQCYTMMDNQAANLCYSKCQ